jgi:hypothetical protein
MMGDNETLHQTEMSANNSLDNGAATEDLARDLVERTQNLLRELQVFDEYVQSRQQRRIPGIGPFVSRVKSEALGHERLLKEVQNLPRDGTTASLDEGKKLRNRLACSNIPWLEVHWGLIKRCRRVVSLGQQFPRALQCKDGNGKGKGGVTGRKDRKDSLTLVDAVVDCGARWIKVISVAENRLLLEMARAGWDWGSESGAEDDITGREGTAQDEESDDDGEVSVIRITRQLKRAARMNWYQYRHPQLQIIFTRITEGKEPEIDKLLRKVRNMGGTDITITIDCAESDFVCSPVPNLDTALTGMLQDSSDDLTPTLNLDCTTLIALFSDICHSNVEPQPWHRDDIRAQIQKERDDNGSSAESLYPLLDGRELVCTTRTAKRIREISATLATETEIERIALGLPEEDAKPLSEQQVRAEFQRLSIHPVPGSLRLPVKIVDVELHDKWEDMVENGELPKVVRAVTPSLLNDVNLEGFLYGWWKGISTVTSNNTLVKQLVRSILEHREPHEKGPIICVHPVTRALASKGKPETPS